jgi:hypothetical protein
MENNKCNLRSVDDFIIQILQIIPEKEKKFICELEDYLNSLWNKGPEIKIDFQGWKPLTNILNKHIPIVSEEWQRKIQNICNNINS